MPDDLVLSRRKLKDIAAAARSGVHRNELIVAARDEVARLADQLDRAHPRQRKPLQHLIARYEETITSLMNW